MLRNAGGARATTTNAGTTKPGEHARHVGRKSSCGVPVAARRPRATKAGQAVGFARLREPKPPQTCRCDRWVLDGFGSSGRQPRGQTAQSRHPDRDRVIHEHGTDRGRHRESVEDQRSRQTRIENADTGRYGNRRGEVADAVSDQHRKEAEPVPGRRASSPQGAHVEAQEAGRAQQPPVRIPDRRPGALKPSRDSAHGPWRALSEATTREHHGRGAGQNEHGHEDRYPGMTQVERAIRHAREQQRTGSPVHGEAERGKQTQQGGASQQQLPRADTVTTQQQTRRRSRRDVSPRQHRTGTHRDPRDAPAVRARQLGEEVPEHDHVAQTGSELQPDRHQRPR